MSTLISSYYEVDDVCLGIPSIVKGEMLRNSCGWIYPIKKKSNSGIQPGN